MGYYVREARPSVGTAGWCSTAGGDGEALQAGVEVSGEGHVPRGSWPDLDQVAAARQRVTSARRRPRAAPRTPRGARIGISRE